MVPHALESGDKSPFLRASGATRSTDQWIIDPCLVLPGIADVFLWSTTALADHHRATDQQPISDGATPLSARTLQEIEACGRQQARQRQELELK